MRSAILGFVLGIAYLQNQAVLPDALMLWCGLLLALFLGLLLWLQSKYASTFQAQWLNVSRICLLTTLGAVLGVMWAALFAHYYLKEELPKSWEGRNVTVIGTIDSLPYRFEQGVRFNFAVERVLTPSGEGALPEPDLPSRLALSWYFSFGEKQIQPTVELLPGERWQMTVRLQRPHGNANPHGFDYEVWLLEQRLRATGYVQLDPDNRRLNDFVWSFSNVVERVRSVLRDRILAALPGKEYAGVMVALVVGDQRAVEQSEWRVFNRTGIGHLISISGLHITMIAGLFAKMIFILWRRSFFTNAQLPLILPAQKAAAVAGALAALVYVLLAGFGVPAQRTLYMLSVVAVALWFDRLTNVSHVLCLALGVVLLLDPWALLWPGFWLSFGAVAVILYASVGRTASQFNVDNTKPERWQAFLTLLKSATHTQYVVTIGLVPLTILLFGQISLLSPIANAVAIPLISLLVTPLALVGAVLPAPLSVWLLLGGHEIMHGLAYVLHYLSNLPFAVWTTPVPDAWIFVWAFLSMLWMLAPRGWPLRWMGVVGWLPLILNVSSHPKEGTMWVTAFDIGQGMALLIETPYHRLLYDTGPYYSPNSNGATRVVLPYLSARGINALDAVLVSHQDNDHSGGALSLFKEIQVGWVASSLWPDHPIVKAAPQHRHCMAGQHWTWDGIRFEMLHPLQESYQNQTEKPNARSCTLKITLGAQSILLPGDIEKAQEVALLQRDADKLRSTVLLAPHHGSGTSSTEYFLRAVQPEIAIFQMGYRNRYHHPKQEVFERYGRLGIQRLRNDESGAITLQFGADKLTSLEYRIEHARYWYGR